MTMTATPIRRVWEMPDHPQYGPVRRLWIMLEQLFADTGGIMKFEMSLWALQKRLGRDPIYWDRHLIFLIDQGQSEASAQRIVMQQVLTASEFVR